MSRDGVIDMDDFRGVAESEGYVVVDPKAPFDIATQYVHHNHVDGEYILIKRHRGDWRIWVNGAWSTVSDDTMRARVYQFFRRLSDYEGAKINATARRVSDVLDALRAYAHLPEEITPPAWLTDRHAIADRHPARIIPTTQSIIDPVTGDLLATTPDLFVTRALPQTYHPDTPKPEQWLDFLMDVWPDDYECIEALQRWMGYCLTNDTRAHVMLWLIGPTRAGKGVMARVIRAILGEDAVVGPNMAALADRFGIEPLIDSPLAIIDDARLPASDATVITERLLSIVGEGEVTVDRKFRQAWSGVLSTRVMVMANELPRLPDNAAALQARVRLLPLTRSWLGKEDRGLADRLIAEAPSIMRWAVDGYRAMLNDGLRIPQPKSGEEMLGGLQALAAPIRSFVEDELELDPTATVAKTIVYDRYRVWCAEQGLRPASAIMFGRDLGTILTTVKEVRPPASTQGPRHRMWSGLRLK